MKTKKKFIRRNYLINKRFQFNHMISMAVMLAVAFVFTAILSGWFYLHVLDPHLTCSNTPPVLWKMGIVFLFILIGMGIWSIKYTYAIAGPIHKLCDILKNAAEGVYPEQPVRFRKRDLFKRMAHPLDHCLSSMKQNRETLNTTLENIEALRADIKAGSLTAGECDRVLGEIVHHINGPKKTENTSGPCP